MSHQPIALLGLGVRLPGGLNSPADLERVLAEGTSVLGPVPDPRWERMRAHLHPSQVPDRPWVAGVVDEVDAFDRAFFQIPADEAAGMDPQQRMLLEVTVEALQDAGIRPSSLAGSRTGVYTGAASFDHATHAFTPGERASIHAGSSSSMAVLANRISHHLDLAGPSLNMDTACSSSGTALHYAIRDLRSGDVDTAIVAGANSLEASPITASFHELGVLADDGVCAPFDTTAHGYVRSEGVGVVVLRRTTDVDGQRHRVYAHIIGSGLSHAGRSKHLLAPRAERQAAAIRAALADAGLSPGRVGVASGHGTATKAGDLEELRGIVKEYGGERDEQAPLLVCSVKGAIGHTEGAAALLGVIVTALGLYRHRVWPTANHTAPLPLVAKKGMRVPTEVESWPVDADGVPLAAGVSSFGFGGSNSHTILTSATQGTAGTTTPSRLLPAMIPLAGHTRSVLADTAARWAEHLQDGDVHAVAATALEDRDHHQHRVAVIARDANAAREALWAVAQGRPHEAVVGPYTFAGLIRERLACVYPGHGAHHEAMAVALQAELPAFADSVQRARKTLAAHVGQPVWAPGDPLAGFEVVQHAGWIVQVALTDTLAEWGIRPAAVVGHSAGEVAAAYAAGALDLEQSAQVMAARSARLATLEGCGGMLAVALGADDARQVAETNGVEAVLFHSPALRAWSRRSRVLAALRTRMKARQVEVAVLNSPTLTVLSGRWPALAKVRSRLDARQVWCKPITDVIPAHSAAVEPVQAHLASDLAGLAPHGGHAEFVSTVTGRALPGKQLTGRYWADQVRAPVRLVEAITHLESQQPTACVEVGARPVLSGHITDTVPATPTATASTDPDLLMRALGALYVHGHTPTGPVHRNSSPAPLPPHAWEHGATAAPVETELPSTHGWTRAHRRQVRDYLTALITQLTGRPLSAVPATDGLGALGVTSLDLVAIVGHLRAAHPAWAAETVTELLASPDLAATVDRLTALLPREEAAVL
jgi:acyl transferase domain-containing protein